MKKLTPVMVVVAIFVVGLATTGFVFAQTPAPQSATPTPGAGYGYGYGMMGGRGMTPGTASRVGMGGGSGVNAACDQDGFMHDDMVAAFAAKLGISVDDLNARLAKGETMAQIASSKGLTSDQFWTLMTDARNQAIDQAVKEGTLTQAQADWMKQHGVGMMAGGRGMTPGTASGVGMGGGRGMMGGAGFRGTGQNQSTNFTCPFLQTNP